MDHLIMKGIDLNRKSKVYYYPGLRDSWLTRLAGLHAYRNAFVSRRGLHVGHFWMQTNKKLVETREKGINMVGASSLKADLVVATGGFLLGKNHY